MSSLPESAPIASSDRVAELDVLRGVALFGVFLANLFGFARGGVMATQAQLEMLPTAGYDAALNGVIFWLVVDKANTLFAFLFGLGFYLQMTRLTERGADFTRIYLRRISVLLIAGIAHLLFLWTWDILHIYGAAAFALFAFRRARSRTLIVWGVLFALFGRTVQEALVQLGLLGDPGNWPWPYSDEAVHLRQQLSLAGDYVGLVKAFIGYTYVDYIITGGFIGWLSYALGRFLIGAWVGRQGWLQNASRYAPQFRRVMKITLPIGLIAEGLTVLMNRHAEGAEMPGLGVLATSLHFFSMPVLATGYVCAIVSGLHTPLGRKLLSPFAASGRMALTNYVTQSFVYAFVLFGVGPGLALAGHIGTTIVVAIVIVIYALQIAFSRWWLSRHRYGPLEWGWRTATYGRLHI
jgi:uncharacterized protein